MHNDAGSTSTPLVFDVIITGNDQTNDILLHIQGITKKDYVCLGNISS